MNAYIAVAVETCTDLRHALSDVDVETFRSAGAVTPGEGFLRIPDLVLASTEVGRVDRQSRVSHREVRVELDCARVEGDRGLLIECAKPRVFGECEGLQCVN